MRASRFLLAAMSLSAALLSCCSSSDDGDGGVDTSSESCNGKGETYTAGMSKVGDEGKLTFVLVSSDPAPPRRYDNTWVIAVKEGDALVEGATLEVAPTMPGHEHPAEGMTITDVGAGSYQATPLRLFMLGLWQIKITATSATGTSDTTTFSFCIE
jgi:hypothetical protein